MKKYFVLTVLTYFVVVIVAGCGKNKLPGGALDATATPTPIYNVNVYVGDLSSQEDPAENVSILMHHPNDYDFVSGGITNISGTADIGVNETGNFILEILPDIDHGFSNSTFHSVTITGDNAQVDIIRTQGNLSIAGPANPSFGQFGDTFTYTITYTTAIDRHIDLIIEDNFSNTSNISYEFPQGTEMLSNGETRDLIIRIPKYSQNEGQNPSFYIKGIKADNTFYETTDQTILQTWNFDMTTNDTPEIITDCEDIFDPKHYGLKINSLDFSHSGITTDNIYIQVMRVEMKKYINAELMWREASYFGGLIDFKINGNKINPYYPTRLYSFESLSDFRIEYEGTCVSPKQGAKALIRFTQKNPQGDFIYEKWFIREY